MEFLFASSDLYLTYHRSALRTLSWHEELCTFPEELLTVFAAREISERILTYATSENILRKYSYLMRHRLATYCKRKDMIHHFQFVHEGSASGAMQLRLVAF